MKTFKNLDRKKLNISITGMLLLVTILITGCGAPKQISSDPQNFDELKRLVEDRMFSIEFKWAQPQGGGIIDLMSNPNHIKFNGDEVDIFLPYFGVRHRGGSYGNSTGGIKYQGKISNLNITEDPSNNNISLKFDGSNETEHLGFIVTLYDNGKAYASVTSSDRTNINFQGGDIKATTKTTEP